MLDNYRSPLLSRPGAAELGTGTLLIDAAGVAWHYGRPLVEQRSIHEGFAIVDRTHRPILEVSGPDAAVFLNNLLSQKLDDAAPGFAASALNLDVQGHIVHQIDISGTESGFYLDLPEGDANTLVDYLNKMVFWSDVKIELTDLGIITLLGDAPVPEVSSAVFSRQQSWGNIIRTDVAIPRSSLDQVTDELVSAGGSLVGLMAFTAQRVRALDPERGVDLDEKSIPHEVAGFIGTPTHLGAVHLNKGCYRGQETVSRVHNLGRSPRVLVLLHLDGSAPTLPEPGSAISAGGRKVGRLGTVVHDFEFGPIALGLLKRSALESNQFAIGDVAASVDKAALAVDEGERPGRAAINKLRGL